MPSTPSDSLPLKTTRIRVRRKQARPAELLDAALDLFVEKGYAATKVETVAARAGVSKGTLFLYFPSKADLFNAVVRENIGIRFRQWNQEFEAFQGSTADMLRYCYHSWWEHVGATKASGITKLMLCEAGNFPEIALFYQREVSEPGHALIRRILQRGIDSGEFRSVDLDYAVHAVVSPLMFLTLSQHASLACVPGSLTVSPPLYLENQINMLLHGLLQPEAGPGILKSQA
ncbi:MULTISPECIES: TetR/AcrR family transcriptional regulator [Giesbergeria]|uniref:TetR/AcrR family transcriptional regulator n=1 Tax=Giesbergeria sinuosa TaxID=80883 RepID=A0ABV9QK05_9BURK